MDNPRTRENVNWNELKLVNYFVCPDCEISFSVDDWNKETRKANSPNENSLTLETNLETMTIGSPYVLLPEGAIQGWSHSCPECKQKFEGSELIIDEWD
jgi:hypothetical protein